MKNYLKMFLWSVITTGIVVSALFAIFSTSTEFAPPAYAATILTTNSTDTLTTFRTNVNTSLTNLNNAIPATTTIAAGGTATGPAFTFATSTSNGAAISIVCTSATCTFTYPNSYITSAPATSTIAGGGGTATGNAFTFATSTGSGALNIVCASATCTFTYPNNVGFFTNDKGYVTSTGANPTSNCGLSAVNGTANTFMRSDGSCAIDQTITPVWTGQHQFSVAGASTTQLTSGSSTLNGVTKVNESIVTSSTITTAKITNGSTTEFAAINTLNVPNGTGPTLAKNGDIALDTTANQFLVYGSSSAWAYQPIVALYPLKVLNATSNVQYDIWDIPANFTLSSIRCKSNANMSMPVTMWRRSFGAAATTTLTTAMPCGANDYTTSTFSNGGTLTAGQFLGVTFGTASGTPNPVFVSPLGYWTLQ